MNAIGIVAAAIALVPAPKEQVWREGTCAFAEKDVRHVRDAALPRRTPTAAASARNSC